MPEDWTSRGIGFPGAIPKMHYSGIFSPRRECPYNESQSDKCGDGRDKTSDEIDYSASQTMAGFCEVRDLDGDDRPDVREQHNGDKGR